MMDTPSTAFPLFEAYPRLAEHLARWPLGAWPTPVTEVRSFHDLPAPGRWFVKREDLSHPRCGGNKVRGLELLLAEARARGARTIVTFGAAGSHHVAKTAWHAARLGIRTVAIVVNQPVANYVRRNLHVGLGARARYVPANFLTAVPKLLWHARRVIDGRASYIPPGGTSQKSCIGHVNAAFELKQQIESGVLPAPDLIYVAAGSLGTAAGLLLGCRLAGLQTRIVGVAVSYRWYCTVKRCLRMARRTLRLLQRLDPTIPTASFDCSGISMETGALGNGYAHFTEASATLGRRFFDVTGIPVDGTYTAKMIHGAALHAASRSSKKGVHLLWHTYHAPAVDAEAGAPPPGLPRRLEQYFREPVQPADELLDLQEFDAAAAPRSDITTGPKT